jgi:HD-GYP domain-containing protein (c-di-GMP phosphodiesterase class II)
VIGERILSAAPALRPVAAIVRASHERWDGLGYPDRLGGDEIPLAARVVAVCDAFHAITTDRCYRPALSDGDAREELRREAGRQFDPAVVHAFLQELSVAGPEPAGPEAQDVDGRATRAAEVASRVCELLPEAVASG